MSIEITAEQQANAVLAAATSALAGVAELTKECRAIIGNDASDRVVGVMLDRLGAFPIPPAVRDVFAKEVQDRSR